MTPWAVMVHDWESGLTSLWECKPTGSLARRHPGNATPQPPCARGGGGAVVMQES